MMRGFVLKAHGAAVVVNAAVLHVRVEGNDSIEGLKWRGAALIEFNGRAWQTKVIDRRRLPTSNGVAQLADSAQLRRPGRRIAYEVQLRPTGADTVFVAGVPEFLEVNAQVYRTGPASPLRDSR